VVLVLGFYLQTRIEELLGQSLNDGLLLVLLLLTCEACMRGMMVLLLMGCEGCMMVMTMVLQPLTLS